MTKIQLVGTAVYTELPAAEVRQYLQKGTKTGSIPGYTDLDKTEGIFISVDAIQFIYRD